METNATFCFKKDCILCIFDKYYSVLQQLLQLHTTSNVLSFPNTNNAIS